MLSKFFFFAKVVFFFSILLFQWSIFYSFSRRLCDVPLFTHHLELWGSCSFHAYPFNRSVVSSFQFLFILSSLASLFNRSVVRIWSSLFLIYLVSTRVVPLCSSFKALQLQGSHDVPCFSFLSECYQFRSTPLCSFFNFSTSQGSLVSLIGRRSNLDLPLLFLFHFSPVPSLDLGVRSSCSGGEM